MSWSWQTLLLPVALGGMQVSSLVLPIFIFHGAWTHGSLSWTGIYIFYPAAFCLGRFFRSFQRIRRYSPIFGIITGIIFYAAFMSWLWLTAPLPGLPSWIFWIARSCNPRNAEFFFLIVAGLLWGLGYRLASMNISISSLLSEFQFGLVIFFVAFFVEAKLALNFPHPLPLILSFFSSALFGAGLALGHDHAGWAPGRYFPSWVALLIAAVALGLSAGLVIAVLVSPSLVQFLFSLLYQAGEWVLQILARLLRFLLSFFSLPDPAAPLPPRPTKPMPPAEEWSPFFLFSDSVREAIRVVWTLVIVSLLLVALWRVSSQILDWLRRRMGNMAGEEVEPLPGAFRADLRILLVWIFSILSFRWFFRFWQKGKIRNQKANSIRQVYAQLLKWSKAKGCDRDRAETPFDYLPRLCELLPEAGPDFTFITQKYVQSRYGSLSPSSHAFEQVQGCWQNIRRIESARQKHPKKNGGVTHDDRKETG